MCLKFTDLMNFCKNKILLSLLLIGLVITIITSIIYAYECKLDTLSTKYSIDNVKKKFSYKYIL